MTVREWIRRSPLIGVVGAPALPGSHGFRGATLEEIERSVVLDAAGYRDAGFDALMIQNVNDLPVPERVGPETVAWLTAIGRAVRGAVDLPLGVSVLKSDGLAALAVAQAVGAEFVRVKVWVGAMVGAEGLVQGSAREVLQYRRHIGAEQIAIWADVLDRSGVPLVPMPVERAARDAARFGRADGLVVTGSDEEETLSWLDRVKEAVSDLPVVAGGGANQRNIARLLAHADGVIVATEAKVGGRLENPVDIEAARSIVDAARASREATA